MSKANSRKELRCNLRHKRRALSPAQQQLAAQQLQRHLAQHPWFLRARHLTLYQASDGEISPHWLLQTAQRLGKQVYLPVVASWPKRHMAFQLLTPHTKWQRNRFGILQPKWQSEQQRPVWALDLICLPLVGFDVNGGRLGMGGGFYDRLLAATQQYKHLRRPPLLGLAHSCQQLEHIPTASWDIPLDAVVTEQGFISCCPS